MMRASVTEKGDLRSRNEVNYNKIIWVGKDVCMNNS